MRTGQGCHYDAVAAVAPYGHLRIEIGKAAIGLRLGNRSYGFGAAGLYQDLWVGIDLCDHADK